MSIREYLPSKQFAKFVGMALLLGGLLFIGIKLIDSRNSVKQNIQNIATREIIEEKDTDNDGVKDWEEALWGLDLHKSDSDGDGILDGQEVTRRKEALRSSEDFVDVPDVPDTETERLARQILTVALNVNQATGGQITEQQIFEITGNFFQGFDADPVVVYKVSDLNISTTRTAQQYYDEMSQALAFLDTVPTNEMAIVEHAIATERERILDELGPIIKAYSEAPEKVLDKEVPQAIAGAHLDYLNALAQKAIALVAMAQYFEDPVIALRGIKEYAVAQENLTVSSQKITNYFQNSGIVR